MSARRSAIVRRSRKNRYRCKKCRSTDVRSKNYEDAVLHICNRCQFPDRVVKP